ncbi:aromatic amino acid exporter YddG [Aquabacter sp. P-9]|uniref:aromatic amino acid exporter YddG n=1 Tax=Aquabacter sediminis TaxID=3029197 RepID=UPI00237E1CD3|nr:EamA family transporter [Aquabacter sp. P-9]MDE1569226.1 EamA family transporter [Aquabacter sp. P-9]
MTAPNAAPLSSRAATRIGLVAILLWATLALSTASTGKVPPFLLTALTFGVGGAVGLVAALRGPGLSVLRQRPAAWVHGIGGLFGYHFFYFTALKLAPPAEAGLIAYLWPLLIVLFSAALPGGGLRAGHIAGALLGLVGTVVLLLGKGGLSGFEMRYAPGYLAALACAFIWSLYSVASRRFGDVPTEAVAGFCLGTAVLAFACHLLTEPAIWPADMGEWIAVLALGIGPVGAAFYAWDIGMKRGDIRFLGVASYAAPVLSTLLLVLAGFAPAHWTLALACALIVGGAALASRSGRQNA